MKSKKMYAMIMIMMFTLLSCEKTGPPDKMQLPEATTTGKNTFGCKIEGKVWRPYSKPFGSRIFDVYFENNSLQIQAWLTDGTCGEYVSVSVNNLTQEGSYQIPPPNFDGEMYRKCGTGIDCRYKVLPEKSKIVITKLDRSQRIVSGTFEYTDMFNRCDTTDIIQITEGRFDFKY
ncbi:MAG: hypothetical protein WAT79_13510 [Saprospiraceae bacterium]